MRAVSILAALVAAACAGEQRADDPPPADTAARAPAATAATAATGDTGATGERATGERATATVRNAGGRELGVLTLTQTAQGIAVSGSLTGLPPGEHAIHLHSTGRCEPPFKSAGGHWNPTNRGHGSQNPRGSHLGDMPNVSAGGDSTVVVRVTTPAGATLRGANGLLDADGAALVIHARADDYRTDPSGNSGDPIACGVVTSERG